MRVEWLYTKTGNVTSAYVWDNMKLIDKFIYQGKLDSKERSKKEKEILQKFKP